MGPLHRRNVGKNENSSINLPQGDTPPEPKKDRVKSRPQMNNYAALFGLGTAQMLLLGYIAIKYDFSSRSRLLWTLFTALVISFPAFLSLAIGLGLVSKTTKDLPHQRYIPLAVAATIIGNQLPTFLSSAMAHIAIVIFGLASRPMPQENEKSNNKNTKIKRGQSTLAGQLRAVFAAILMFLVLLIENFFIWVVSATYEQSQSEIKNRLPQPLQDNGQIVMRSFFKSILGLKRRQVATLRNMMNVEWILVSCLALSIVSLEMDGYRMKRNLWSLAQRALLTVAIARVIRTISFLITVLPSQNRNCYFRRFPTPPEDWISWLLVGLTPRVNGGCNDLIISGHATITTTLACLATSIVGKPLFTSAIWILLVLDYMVEIYEGYHYSVGMYLNLRSESETLLCPALSYNKLSLCFYLSKDMWLGALFVNFIWITLAPIEANAHQEVEPKKFHQLSDATLSDFCKYLLPALVSYLQINGILIPQDFGNYSLILYFVVVSLLVYKNGFTQYTQHILICVLFMGLGLYL